LNRLQAAYFDNYAAAYDSHFTGSPAGRAQRELVHDFLGGLADRKKSVLEINAGTGEDALRLSEGFAKWLCSDISPSMLEICRNKLSSHARCSVMESSIQEIEKNVSEKFDLVFSNFGGLNCLGTDEIRAFAASCSNIMNLNGELVLVIMGRKCLWEKFYFRVKRNSAAAKRRLRLESVPVNIEGTLCNTWYYSPDEIKKIFAGHFSVRACRPVGFFIPPSYLNPFFRRHPVLFSVLKKMESLVSRMPGLSDYSDHFLIHLQKK
jgi:ubiquinone/menaquinone biosynthesis C-methylase UbiE